MDIIDHINLTHQKLDLSNKYQNNLNLSMFSFGNTNQDDQNTPFFEDNEQKPSLFTSQASQQFSVYDLFNNNMNGSRMGESSFANFKQIGKQSKKSLILELDQFDKKHVYKQLQNKYNQQQLLEAQSQSNNQINYNIKITNPQSKLAESTVQRYQQSELFKKNQINQQKREELKDDLKQKEIKKEPTIKLNSEKFSFHQNKQRSKFKLLNNFSQNKPKTFAQSKQQKNIQSREELKSKLKASGQKEDKQQQNKKINSLSLKFNSQKLKSSRVLSSQNLNQNENSKTIKNQQQKQQEGTKSSKNDNLNNKFTLNNFSSLLKRSTVTTNKTQQKKEKAEQIKQSKQLKLEQHIRAQKVQVNSNIKEKKGFDLSKFNKSTFGNNFKKQTTQEKVVDKEQNKTEIQINKQKHKQTQMQLQKQKQEQKNKQKIIKPKQKPCFNLKLIRQPKKTQDRNGLNQKKMQNNLVKQQINKRQDINTAKILRNTQFKKQIQIPQTKKQPFSNYINSKKEQKTPKLQKIQSKTSKLLLLRTTEKLNQEKACQKSQNIQIKRMKNTKETLKQQIRQHRVDYEKYEDEIFSLYQQVDNTKKKTLACQNSYRQIFLLLSKANTKLNNRSMSQTQQSEINQKKQ